MEEQYLTIKTLEIGKIVWATMVHKNALVLY